MTNEPNEVEFEFTGDFANDAVMLISRTDVQKTVIPGHLNGEDVYVLTAIVASDLDGEMLFPIAVLLTEQIHDELELPDDITEIPPAIPMRGRD